MIGLRLNSLATSFEYLMASSELSGYLGSFEGTVDDGPERINIDEALEAAVEEAENQDDASEEPRDYLDGQSLRRLSTSLYDAFQIFKTDGL